MDGYLPCSHGSKESAPNNAVQCDITYCAAIIKADRTLNLQKAMYTLPPGASYVFMVSILGKIGHGQ